MTASLVLLIARTALVLALYLFFAWALFQLWQDLRQQKRAIAGQQPPELWLEIEVNEAIQSRPFHSREITLGRDPTCECILSSETVSARHARLRFHHGQWWLEDLKSTNGTFLNDDLITTEVVVAAGDQIRCGEVAIQILKENQAP